MSLTKLTKHNMEEINGAIASAQTAKEDFKNLIVPELEEKKKRGRKKGKNYIDPEIFKNQILQFYKDGVLTTELGIAINDIANRMAFRPNFINYSYREEMIGDAIIKMICALKNKKFDPKKGKVGNKGNPFSYYSKIAFNAFRNRIKKEKRNNEAIINYQTDVYETLIHTGNMPDDKAQPETQETEESI